MSRKIKVLLTTEIEVDCDPSRWDAFLDFLKKQHKKTYKNMKKDPAGLDLQNGLLACVMAEENRDLFDRLVIGLVADRLVSELDGYSDIADLMVDLAVRYRDANPDDLIAREFAAEIELGLHDDEDIGFIVPSVFMEPVGVEGAGVARGMLSAGVPEISVKIDGSELKIGGDDE